MSDFIKTLGFDTPEGLVWNTCAYLSFIAVIIGVAWEKYRNALITAGTVVLIAYAALFLKDILLTALQCVVVISGTLKLVKASKKTVLVVMLKAAVAAFLVLIFTDSITGIWSVVGSVGLLCISFGLMILPKRYGFLIMATGGLLLTMYSFTVSAWVFVVLNGIHANVSVCTWLKAK